MSKKFSFYLAVSLLAICGLAIAVLRHLETGIPFTPGQGLAVWEVEARIDFTATGEAATVSLSLPDQSPGFGLLSEQSASPGYGYSILIEDGNRRGEWTKREVEGEQSLYYSAQFSEIENFEPSLPEQEPEAAPVFWDDAQGTAAEETVNIARSTSSNPESFTREMIKLFNLPELGQNMSLLLAAEDSNAELLQKLLNYSGIPARIVNGLYLEDARRRQLLTPMVEVYNGDRWMLFDPETGVSGLPENFLLWHRTGISVLDVTGGVQSRVSFSIIRQTLPALLLIAGQESRMARY